MVVLPNIRRKYMEWRVPRGAPIPMSGCVVTLASGSVSYTGGARTVGVTVTWNGDALTVNEDYTLSFANNVNLGPATVTVTGMGQFTGSVTKTFYIVSSSSSSWADFDLSKSVFVQKSSSPVGDEASAWSRARSVSPDGKKLFTCYKKPYVVSFSGVLSLSSYVSTEEGTSDLFYGTEGYGSITWSQDGLHFVAVGNRYFSPVYHVMLCAGAVTTPFSVSEASFDQNNCKILSSLGYPGMISVSADGTMVFLSEGYGSSISAGSSDGKGLYKVSLSTPFDLSSADTPEQVVVAGSLTDETRTLRNIFLSPDGRFMIVVWNRWVQKYSLQNAYDFSAMTLNSSFDPYVKAGNDGGNFSGCMIDNSGAKMVLYSGGTQSLYEFSLTV